MGTGDGPRRRRRLEADDNGGDEEYVLEEEEEEEEEYGGEFSASSAGEEGGGSDAEYEVDEEDEDCDTPRPKRPVKGVDCGRKRKANPATARSRRRRYEEDDDYLEELEEDEEIDDYHEDLEQEEEVPRLKCATKCAGRSQKAKLPLVAERSNRRRHEEEDMDFDPDLDEDEEAEDMDFDPDLDEDEEAEDMDFDPEVEGVDEEEFEDEEEEELGVSHTRKVRAKNTGRRKRSPKQRGEKKKNSSSKVSRRKVSSAKVRKATTVRQRRKRSVIDHYEDDDDFIVEDQVKVNRQSRKKARFGRQMEVDHPVPVVEADTWPTVDSDTSDFEFVTSDEEAEDVEPAVVKPVRVTVRKGRKKRTIVSGSSSDSEFHVSDKELGDFRETEPLEAERKKRTFISQSSSDSEFHVSDKELENSREIERKKRIFILESSSDSEFDISDKKEFGDFRETEPLEAKRKRRIFVSESSPDSEFHASDKELGNFRNAGPLEARPMLPAPPRRISVKRNGEDKGKEKKELMDAGKPRCGICLSEDQRTTLQGLLNCCSHYFCFACIMEWSRVESRCPLCKRRFTTITKSSKVNLGLEPKKSVIRVEERDQVYQPTEEEIRRWLDPYENLVCIECNQGGDDSLMLLCDICDSSAHTYCVGLGREVPEGNWYCGGCRLSGEGPSHPRSPINSNSVELGTSALIGTFGRSSSINPRQTFEGFDLNVSPREIPGENHPAESQASTVGVSTPSGRLGTLSRRRGWIRILLDRQRPAISPDVGHNGVQNSGYVPRTELDHRNFSAPSEANTSQHSGSVPRTEPNHRNFEATSEANTSQTMPRYRRISLDRPRPTIGLHVGHNGVQHSGSVPRTEPNRRNFRVPSEANTSQTLLDDVRNQNNCFPLVQTQRNSSPCISVDGNNFQQTEGVKSNVKHMCSISPH